MKGQAVVLCGRCIRPPEVPDTASPEDEVVCPTCQQTDTVARVLSDARKHATHQAARSLDKRTVARGGRVRSFTPTRVPFKGLRWISGLSSD